MITITTLIDDAKCYEIIRQFRWPDGVCCPRCNSKEIAKRGKDETQPERQRYYCKQCERQFDDLTGSIFAGRHQPLRVWVGCLYLMGFNLSNQQIGKELDLHKDDAQRMCNELRQAIVSQKPEINLSGEVEFDEVYVTAGHKGRPDEVKKSRKGRCRKLKGLLFEKQATWSGHPRNGKTADLRNDSARWRSSDPNASECSANNHCPDYQSDGEFGQLDLYR